MIQYQHNQPGHVNDLFVRSQETEKHQGKENKVKTMEAFYEFGIVVILTPGTIGNGGFFPNFHSNDPFRILQSNVDTVDA